MRIFRQDGDRHEFAGHCLSALIAVTTQNPIAIASSITATLLLSPDVDQAKSPYKSKALHRWKRLNLLWMWQLFRMLPGTHHRGVTHTPVLGAIVVLAWVAWPFLLIPGVLPWVEQHWIAIAAPVVAQQLVHLCLDR